MDDAPTQNARQTLTACRPLRRLWFLVFLLPLFPSENGGEARPLVDCVSVVGVKTEGGKIASRSTPGMRTGFVYDDIYLRDEPACGHPERPERLTAIVARLEEAGLLAQLERFQPRPVKEKWLTTVHSADYVRRACTECRPERYSAALFAVGGVLTAVDAVVAGKVRNAFCTVRPPGHHATKDRGGGYCVFNNVAIAARYAPQKHRLAKVLIVDWDVHHGNGTQSIFYDDPSVLYFSVHRAQIYGPTGTAAERGKGKGVGFTLNVPPRSGGPARRNCSQPPDGSIPTWFSFRLDSTPPNAVVAA